MICLPGLAPKPATLGSALLEFSWENQVAGIIANPISGAGNVHSGTGQSSVKWIVSFEEKLIVLLRQVAPDVLYFQVEVRAPEDIMCAVGFGNEWKRRGKSLSELSLTISERSKELH